MDLATTLSVFLETHSYIVYPVLFAGAYLEILIPFSFFIPGEIFFYTAGVLAAGGLLNVWIASAVLIVGEMCGDGTSFFLGRRYASTIERWMNKMSFTKKIYVRGRDFFEKRGSAAVFLSRFFGPAAWVTPFFAGAAKMPWKRFAKLEPFPAAVTISINVGIGYGIGLGYQTLDKVIHHYALTVSIALVFLAIFISLSYRHLWKIL